MNENQTATAAAPQKTNKSSTAPKRTTSKFSAAADAARLESIANGLSYNNKSEAATKHTLNEIAMRLASGGYCTK